MTEQDLKAAILIVEDDELVQAAMRDALTSSDTMMLSVSCSSSAGEALEALEQNSFDLVLLDIVLPDSDGFGIAEILRKKQIPFFMISARTLPMDAIAGFEAGAEDYLRKPVNGRELAVRVRHFLEQRSKLPSATEAAPGCLRIGRLSVDTNSRQATLGKRTIDLTPIETDILIFLSSSAGMYVATEKIIEHIWGSEAPADGQQTVRVHIRRLRSKLEDDPRRPTLIKNRWGAGYMLSPPGED